MKKFLTILFILVSYLSFGQNPSNYQYRTVRERLIAFMADSTFHLPRYNGTPTGIRTGSSTHAGALAIDTANMRLYMWGDYVWTRLARYDDILGQRFGVSGEDETATTDRNFDLDSNSLNISNGNGISLGAYDHGFFVIDNGTETSEAGANSTNSYLTSYDNSIGARFSEILVYPDSIIVSPRNGNIHLRNTTYNSGASLVGLAIDTLTNRVYRKTAGGTDTHFGNTNLTQTASRTYSGAGYNYTFDNIGNWEFYPSSGSDFRWYGTGSSSEVEFDADVYALYDVTGNNLRIGIDNNNSQFLSADGNSYFTMSDSTSEWRSYRNTGGVRYSTILMDAGLTGIGGISMNADATNGTDYATFDMLQGSTNLFSSKRMHFSAFDSVVFDLEPSATKVPFRFYGLPITDTASMVVTAAWQPGENSVRLVLQDKSTLGGGSGTINSGTSGKPAYYTASTTLDDFAAVDYATSGTNVKITSQNTTDVPFEVKGISSQSGNLINISSSGGTGDLWVLNSSGELIAAGNSDIGAYDLQLDKGIFISNVENTTAGILIDDGEDNSNVLQVGYNSSGSGWGILTTSKDILIRTNSSGDVNLSPAANLLLSPGNTLTAYFSTTGFYMNELAAPSTPPSGRIVFYPKSDGNVYTKDDAGNEFNTSRPGRQGADVASVAGAIALGTDGNTFEITGTNAITLISNVGWQNGSVITLIFTSTASLTDGTANSGTDIGFELASSTNFTATADDTITLRLSEVGGTQRWREIARSVN